ncbi:hypothetical protein OG735_19770 [Streptomyces sp. NBC_01210]|uniref:hypothetical protein n=1 Tax=Streptomyces sp. NBC_01210 TaxID=2903774 RepID=UPI002E1667EE|nr:hypothetical protein OG735_19770 [Streptomyces sp. NBC_01210]
MGAVEARGSGNSVTIIPVFTLSGPHICAPHCALRTRAPRATGFSLPVNSKKSEDSSAAF